jgi:hypothetical protein
LVFLAKVRIHVQVTVASLTKAIAEFIRGAFRDAVAASFLSLESLKSLGRSD